MVDIGTIIRKSISLGLPTFKIALNEYLKHVLTGLYGL